MTKNIVLPWLICLIYILKLYSDLESNFTITIYFPKFPFKSYIIIIKKYYCNIWPWCLSTWLFSKLQNAYKHDNKWVQTLSEKLIPHIQTPTATVAMVWILQTHTLSIIPITPVTCLFQQNWMVLTTHHGLNLWFMLSQPRTKLALSMDPFNHLQK